MKKLLYILLFALLLSCSSDPCEEISCQNGAACDDGNCLCEDGYTGNLCESEIKPDKIFITKVVVTSFSNYDSDNNEWDAFGDNADITFRINKGDTEIYSHNTFYEDAVSSQDYTFTLSTNPIELNDVNNIYAILLYDYDDGFGDDYMGGITFTPYKDGDNFPEKVEVSIDNYPISFELYFSYEHGN